MFRELRIFALIFGGLFLTGFGLLSFFEKLNILSLSMSASGAGLAWGGAETS